MTKKDIILLRFYKLVSNVDFTDLNDRERYALLMEFRVSTDNVLAAAGLPPIYMGNPFEYAVVTALCADDPSVFLPETLRQLPMRGRPS